MAKVPTHDCGPSHLLVIDDGIDDESREGHRPSASLGVEPSCDETELLEDGLSAEFFQHFCETDNLESVLHLEIQIDSAEQTVETVGEHLPNLIQLRLTDSNVPCLRDLGTALMQLQVLWMSRCGLQDLNGVTALPSLREFYLSFNEIADLSPLSAHESLVVLDLEGNAVHESDEVAVLRMCSQLRELTLCGNPLCRSADYSHQMVLDMLPQLAVLDDVHVSPCQDSENTGTHDNCVSDNVARSPLVDQSENRDVFDREECSDTDIDAYEGEDSMTISPLNPSNPLLAEGLREVQAENVSPYAGEPDEHELILERLKRARRKHQTNFSFTARPSAGPWFSQQVPDRRQVRTADADVGSSRPPMTTSGLHSEEVRGYHGSASDLTCGNSLAGSPLTAVRQRRRYAAGAGSSSDVGVDIRELLRRYQTYTQPSCIPAEELRNRKLAADQRRTGTPDVRIHTMVCPQARPGSALGPPALRRPGSALSRSASRPSTATSRPDTAFRRSYTVSSRPSSAFMRPGSGHARQHCQESMQGGRRIVSSTSFEKGMRFHSETLLTEDEPLEID